MLAFLFAPGTGNSTLSAAPVNFDRDIRPILSDKCFTCHGPDNTKRKADLRLDTKSGLFSMRDDGPVVQSGQPLKSLLYQRITTNDSDLKMPPADSGKSLSAKEIALLKSWIESGANWQKHWAFVVPVRPKIPQSKHQTWIRNPIDAFVLSRLEREGLSPAPPANRVTWLRRVSLDLTGLPPTPEEVDAFLADRSPKAFEKVVDRLLNSNRFGEKMAVHWLDAARYADTSGYQNDGPREMWRWRDWVIEAFNDNKPFDQFTIEQIAGDMLPNATLDQKIATAFNRNHRGNAEGGIIPEEFQVEYVVDRVETTFTVFQGLTMGCARCHEHKFDPFTQKDFYRVFAYFNNIPESGRAIKEGNSPPFIKAPTRSQQQHLAKLDARLKTLNQQFQSLQPALKQAQFRWEKTVNPNTNIEWTIPRKLVAHFPLNGDIRNRASADNKTQNHPPHAKFMDGQPAFTTDDTVGKAALFDGQRYIDAGQVANFGYFNTFSLAARIRPDGQTGGTILSKMTDVERGDGYSLVLKNGRLQFNLVKRWLDDSIRVETKRTLPAGKWSHITATYDGSRVASGLKIYVDGQPWALNVKLDGINQSFAASKEPLRIGAGGGPNSRFHGHISDVRIFDTDLTRAEAAILSVQKSIIDIAKTPSQKRTEAEKIKLATWFVSVKAPEDIRKTYHQRNQLQWKRDAYYDELPTVMVMQERPKRRPTFVLKRGEYDNPGEPVQPNIPASFGPFPKEMKNNRLGFARWLVHRSNPLTARVTVNRFWQMLFGTGLVKTAEDFGTQGERPSHPQLLDWLAVEFQEKGWNVKALLKQIVLSATYRQSSDVSPTLWKRDPENRLLARGPRFRLPAETIRDQALAIAGLLTEKVGGPSVKPYQPAGLWKEIATVAKYDQSHGPDLYRRSLYTYGKRTVAAPMMTTFDGTAREFCIVRRARTNTPLQALALLNDVTFVEAARVLAQRMMTKAGRSPQSRITFAFRRATGRKPNPQELKILVAGYHAHLRSYQRNIPAAEKLISTGEYPRNKKLNPAKHAAYTAIASIILNLDEVVTKE
ncbi:MAG: DUF1553 domain-containing protein [Planctomycetaceae bacterium]